MEKQQRTSRVSFCMEKLLKVHFAVTKLERDARTFEKAICKAAGHNVVMIFFCIFTARLWFRVS